MMSYAISWYEYGCNGDPIPSAPCCSCGRGEISLAPLCLLEDGRPLCDSCARKRCPELVLLVLRVARLEEPHCLLAIDTLARAGEMVADADARRAASAIPETPEPLVVGTDGKAIDGDDDVPF